MSAIGSNRKLSDTLIPKTFGKRLSSRWLRFLRPLTYYFLRDMRRFFFSSKQLGSRLLLSLPLFLQSFSAPICQTHIIVFVRCKPLKIMLKQADG